MFFLLFRALRPILTPNNNIKTAKKKVILFFYVTFAHQIGFSPYQAISL